MNEKNRKKCYIGGEWEERKNVIEYDWGLIIQSI